MQSVPKLCIMLLLKQRLICKSLSQNPNKNLDMESKYSRIFFNDIEAYIIKEKS